MESVESISDTLKDIVGWFHATHDVDIGYESYSADIPFCTGLSQVDFPSRSSHVMLIIPEKTDDICSYDGFRTMEASAVLAHELNHVYQGLVLYPSMSSEALDLVVFDIISKYMPEYSKENAPDFYIRNPKELQSELFAIKNFDFFLSTVRPNLFSDVQLESGKLDYVNHRIRWSDGPWFFPIPSAGQYSSLSDFLNVAEHAYQNSFHESLELKNMKDGSYSKYMRYLMSPSSGDLSYRLESNPDALVVASTLSDIVNKFESSLKLDYFGTADIDFKNSIFDEKRLNFFDRVYDFIHPFACDENSKGIDSDDLQGGINY